MEKTILAELKKRMAELLIKKILAANKCRVCFFRLKEYVLLTKLYETLQLDTVSTLLHISLSLSLTLSRSVSHHGSWFLSPLRSVFVAI